MLCGPNELCSSFRARVCPIQADAGGVDERGFQPVEDLSLWKDHQQAAISNLKDAVVGDRLGPQFIPWISLCFKSTSRSSADAGQFPFPESRKNEVVEMCPLMFALPGNFVGAGRRRGNPYMPRCIWNM